jgi:hypothetical protein
MSHRQEGGGTQAPGPVFRTGSPYRFPRAALRWHARPCREVNISLRGSAGRACFARTQAGEWKGNAAFALADLLSRRGLERPCETLVAGARGVERLPNAIAANLFALGGSSRR